MRSLDAFLRRKRLVFSSYSLSKRRKGQPLYSIALFSPDKVPGMKELPLFFPTEFMLAQVKCGAMSREEYRQRFLVLLDERREKISRLLPQLPDGAVLCCWCSLKVTADNPEPFCHRQVVADYLVRKFGVLAEVE